MKRSDILSLLVGMDSEKAKDACDAILNLHNAEMEDAKTRVDYTGYVKKEDYDKIAAENKALKDGSEKYKDYEELAKFKADTLANQTNAKKISAIEALLRQNNANEKVIKLLAKSVDLSKVELDEKGEIKDSKSIIDSLKSDNAELFTSSTTSGATPATPPKNDNGKTITKEQFAKMGYNERVKLYNEDRELYETLKGE